MSGAEYPVPVPVVALMGMDEMHAQIEEHISKDKKTGTGRLKLVSLQMGATFPPKKPKKSRGSHLLIQGIIKSSWLEKHLKSSPGVVVMLFEFRAGSPVFATEAWAQIELMRKAVLERQVQLIVGWVLSPSDIAEFEAFRSEFVNKHGDSIRMMVIETADLALSVARFEEVCQKAALLHYGSKLKQLKKDRARFNRNTQPLAQVRNYFKSAFYDEVVLDTKQALKHYQRALEYLVKDPIAMDPSKLMEQKVVAELIALRACKVLLLKGDVNGACSCLLRMLAEFKAGQRIGPESLAFQHYGWLAHVHEAFAKLLELYGLKGEDYSAGPENPGSHYQAAAHYTVLRRACALKRLNKVGGVAQLPQTESMPDTPSRLDPARQKYVGQPYEEFQHPLEQKGFAEREKGVLPDLELAKELNMPHSETIISLLHYAYKYNRGPAHRRRQLHIACSLADEHFQAGAYDLALKFYAEISHSRGLKQWGSVLEHVRKRASECARKLELAEDFVRHSLDLLSSSALSGHKASRELEERKEALFGETLDTLKNFSNPPLVIDLSLSVPVEIKCEWQHPISAGPLEFEAPVVVVVSIKSRLPKVCENGVLELEMLGVHGHGSEPVLQRVENVKLEAESDWKEIVVTLNEIPDPLSHVSIGCVWLKLFDDRLHFQVLNPSCPLLMIAGRPSAVEVSLKKAPKVWLEDDSSDIVLSIRNPEQEKALVRGKVMIDYQDVSTGQLLPVASDGVLPVYFSSTSGEPVSELELPGALEPGQEVEVRFSLRFVTFGDQTFSIRLDYDTAEYSASSSLSVHAKVHKPFVCRFQLHRTTMQPLSLRDPVAHVDRPLLVATVLENSSDTEVCITDIELVLEEENGAARKTSQNKVKETTLHPGSHFTWWDSVFISERKSRQQWGHVRIRWKRPSTGEEKHAVVEAKANLPPFASDDLTFEFEVDAPKQAGLGEEFQVMVHCKNKSAMTQQMFLKVRERRIQSDVQSYVLEGPKSMQFKILPKTSWTATYFITSLVPGELPLPSFIVKSKRDNSTVEGSDLGRTVSIQ